MGAHALTRRDFLLLAGAGAMGVAGLSLLGAREYENVTGRRLSGGKPLNVILIIIDSLRKDHVGAYGNDWIQTPNLDAFARESLRFTRAQPESTPTIPARRTIHTGLRTFPFRDWDPHKGESVLLYGWQPIPEQQWTTAEILQAEGFETMLVTDSYHEAKAAMNFQRGFNVFDFIRGQENDHFQPMWMCPQEKINNTLLSGDRKNVEGKMRQYFANTAGRSGEQDYFSPQVFSRAALPRRRQQERPSVLPHR